uniref:K Homology domain-containing protein n=1 Tax=Panagrolaimus sp. JU765 TaxID=591449 RepID=A0AC34QMR3_9BILA
MNSFITQPPNDFHSNLASNGFEQRLTVDQILQLMNQVANSVKANDFSAQLANSIFLLCQQLKTHGQHLEQNHKSELNRCFVALRQACCRDSGQLGTPCRLKMMEIVELRAMAWRPNLAHTQYYLGRGQSGQPDQPPTQSPVTNVAVSQASPIFTPTLHSPFNQFIPPQQTQPLFVPEMQQNPSAIPPGYFFIPTGAPGWQGQMLHNPAAGLLGGPPQPQLVDPWTASRNAAAAAAAATVLMNGTAMGKANAALGLKNPRLVGVNLTTTPPVNPKSNKSAQFREEVTIRNCDSGKIMGVKGRRVAVVEELSKTVISFQKVDPKSKDRVLTITGSTEESIQFAKKLVEETIRRNVSPNRFHEDSMGNSQLLAASPPVSAPVAPEEEDDDDDDGGPGISIETAQDGTLKLCCDDPDMLQAAQMALSEYLNRARRSNRMTAEERAEKAERRKSMPLQTAKKEEKPAPTIKESRRALTGSVPNLAADLAQGLSIDDKIPQPAPENTSLTTRYSREQLLEIRESSEGTEILKNVDPEIKDELAKKSESTFDFNDLNISPRLVAFKSPSSFFLSHC